MRRLAIREVTVGEAREGYVARLRQRRDDAKARGLNFWVFASESDPGRFVEFTEGRDLVAVEGAGSLYTEVELD